MTLDNPFDPPDFFTAAALYETPGHVYDANRDSFDLPFMDGMDDDNGLPDGDDLLGNAVSRESARCPSLHSLTAWIA